MRVKRCAKCKEELSIGNFYRSNSSYCKRCTQAINIDWANRNKDRIREYQNRWHREKRQREPGCFAIYEKRKTLKKFGKTVEWYEQTLRDQNGACAICGKPETAVHQNGRVVSLSIDHDHNTGKVRGLLCRLCNHHLHSVEHNPYWPFMAVAYLSRFK
jgi:Autographiviridae endonuclease VII